MWRIFSLVLLSLYVLTLPSAYSISFNFTGSDFSSSENILFQGDAKCSNGTVELTNVVYEARTGLITYANKVRLWDRNSGKVSDFSTHFSFAIITQNMTNYGYGLAFFVAPFGFQIPSNSAFGFMGLFNSSLYSSSNQIIAVEFDTMSSYRRDPSYKHVGIDINTIGSSILKPWNASGYSGDITDVWIDYNASKKNLTVLWSNRAQIDTQNSSLSLQVDVTKIVPEWVSIGFSATSGKVVERHIIHSWEFYSSLDATEKAPWDEIDKNKKIKSRISFIVSVCAAGICVLMGLTVFVLHRWRLMKMKKAEETSFNNEVERGVGPRRFCYSELELATNNFSIDHKVGQGGFGAVYKGYLTDLDMTIAVKKFLRGSKQGKKEYITEVKIISGLRHRNLVQLIGWCHGKGECVLVYEFLPNGSLDSHLFGMKAPLNWSTRYRIALGLASGLLYLHEEWHQCVVHRDIKSSNIMLDSNFDVKLGDFGLATLMDHGNTAQKLTLAGTYGYMAPEYIATGKASKESDIYSFGVVALEIATGRRSSLDVIDVSGNQNGLIQWVWDLYGNGKLVSAIDESLRNEFDAKEVECLMLVGLWCAHPDYNLRPSIKQAIQVLDFQATLPSLPPRMPIPNYHVPFLSNSNTSCASLGITSLEVGR